MKLYVRKARDDPTVMPEKLNRELEKQQEDVEETRRAEALAAHGFKPHSAERRHYSTEDGWHVVTDEGRSIKNHRRRDIRGRWFAS